MRKVSLGAIGLVALVVAVPAAQQTPADVAFRYERPVQTGGPGPRRLPIDVALLTGSGSLQTAAGAAHVGDLRLFDPAGQEVQYLLVSNPPEQPVWRTASTLPIAPVETPSQKTSGFEVDLGQAITIDRINVDGVAPPFLKRVRLEGSGDRARWTLLVDEGTLFHLPEEGLLQTELAFAPGPYRYLRLTWDDTRSGTVERPPLSSVREVRNVVASPPLTTPLAFERRPGEPGRSQFRLRLPASRLPIVALDLDMGGTHILREATVFEARLVGSQISPLPLGKATLRRVVRDELTASSLRIPINAPVEAQLDLVIDDGNNPPSDVRAVTAVFAELPWIYFESTGDSIVARYGAPSLQAPKYDLEAVRATIALDSTPNATWGEARMRSPEENTSRAVPALPTVGSVLDVARFQYLRPIPPGAAGLVTVLLDAPALAHSKGVGFADVRVVNAEGRQVPYLVERASEPLSLDLTIEPLATRPATLQSNRTTSVYRVRLPLEGLPPSRLVLSSSARVFTRQVTVGIERPPDRRNRDPRFETLATSNWAHSDQESPAPALTMELRRLDVQDVLVTIEEGDNSPLPLDSARLLLPAYRLRLFRERDAALQLAYGRDDLSPPEYDLALLAPQLLGVAATEVVPGAEQAAGPSSPTVLMSPRLFWGVLVVAVLVLLGLVVRLVRKSDVQSPSPQADLPPSPG
jgi:hypothetical protein